MYELSTTVQLSPKYLQERIFAPMKMRDLLSLKSFMGPAGNWINTLNQRWKNIKSQSHEDEELENASPEQGESEDHNQLDKIFECDSVKRLQ